MMPGGCYEAGATLYLKINKCCGIWGSHSAEHGECRQDYVWASRWYV